MESRTRRRSPRLFNHNISTDLLEPGEYGTANSREGWVRLKVGNQTIYLASEKYALQLAAQFNIPSDSVVSLNRPYGSQKTGIPEALLAGPFGLALFKERLTKIKSKSETVIIHCKRGINRTPVAAVIYLIENGMTAADAEKLVTTTYQQQRDENFVFNGCGNYSLVLEEKGIKMAPRTRRARVN